MCITVSVQYLTTVDCRRLLLKAESNPGEGTAVGPFLYRAAAGGVP